MTATLFAFAVLGCAMIIYGLSPLSGTTVSKGVSERGCVVAIIGIALFAGVGIVVVAG